MPAMIFGYFGTLTEPGAEEYRQPRGAAAATVVAEMEWAAVRR
jgi:hypothetical protein